MIEIFGTPSIVSEVLREKRGLTIEHIRRLSQRFHVSPEVFF
jgi:HTH-type transcriptional regulator/antitoxin HigA